MRKYKKILIIVIASVFMVVIVAISAISPIVKYLVEKYDEKYTGRQIKMDGVYANPFTGYVHFSNLKIYEFKSDSLFMSADGLSINISLAKLLSRTFEISQLTLDHPSGIIIQNRKKFSIDDLIAKFSPDKNHKARKPFHVNILNIKINNGEFYYREEVTPINYFIKNVNIESSGKLWNVDSIAAGFSFLPGTGTGNVNAYCSINFKNLDYRLSLVAIDFNLQIIEQYLKKLTNNASFRANVNANVKASGNFKDGENINAKGMLAVNDFHFGKNPKDDMASFGKLVLAVDALSPKGHKYLFDSVSVDHPFFKYEQYDHLNNMETMFGAHGSLVVAANSDPTSFNLVIEIAKYVKVLSKNFLKSNYRINRLAISKGDFEFNDYSQSEKFSCKVSPLFVAADSINKGQKRVVAVLKSGIQPYGNMNLRLSINPNDSSDFDLDYHLQKISVAMFNPYIISFTSFPLDRGSLEVKGSWKVREGRIQSTNHLLIIDPRISNRLRNNDHRWLPLRLTMFFIRERGNVIDYEIPITGNLNAPDFHLKNIIFHLVENTFIKPPTTPYTIEVKNTEDKVEKSLALEWEMSKSSFQENEEGFIYKLAGFLKDNPNASISVHPEQFTEKEKEYILFYEAKKKYFLIKHNEKKISFSETDSLEVDKMSVKDTLFVQYLAKHLTDSTAFSIQQKCEDFIGNKIVETRYKQLINQRVDLFRSYFKENGTENQVRIYKDRSMIPFNGFSFYEVNYNGVFPEYLIKAYQHMNELNSEIPRSKYRKKRKKIILGTR